jgi:hypothetical protein
MSYQEKYLKYKSKYLELKKQIGATRQDPMKCPSMPINKYIVPYIRPYTYEVIDFSRAPQLGERAVYEKAVYGNNLDIIGKTNNELYSTKDKIKGTIRLIKQDFLINSLTNSNNSGIKILVEMHCDPGTNEAQWICDDIKNFKLIKDGNLLPINKLDYTINKFNEPEPFKMTVGMNKGQRLDILNDLSSSSEVPKNSRESFGKMK